MGAKIDPKSEKGGKTACQKSMLKFDAAKRDGTFSDLAFWIEFLGGLGVWGLANFRLWQILGKTLGDFTVV